MKNIISITEARSDIFDIAEKVQKQGNHYIFTEKGKAKMAVMSAEEYENLMEDLALAADPKFRAKIEKAHADIAKGDYVIWSDVKASLDRRKSLIVADKSKGGYSVKKSKKNNK